MLRSAVLARDLLQWNDSELRARGIGADLAAVTHLSDVFDAAMDDSTRPLACCWKRRSGC